MKTWKRSLKRNMDINLEKAREKRPHVTVLKRGMSNCLKVRRNNQVQWKVRESETSVTGEKRGAGKATTRDRWKAQQIRKPRETVGDRRIMLENETH